MHPPSLRAAAIRPLALAGFAAAALAALAAAALLSAHHHRDQAAPPPVPPSAGSSALVDEIAYWTCSMHPEVRAPGPGTCPICKMDLSPVRRSELASGEVVIDEARRQAIGVRVEPAQARALTVTVRAAGTLAYDGSRLVDVAVRAAGWIADLRVNAVGERVAAGAPLFTLDSPELAAAEGEYLAALGFDDPIATRAARTRLATLGADDGEVARLERERVPSRAIPIRSPIDGVVIEKGVAPGTRVEPGLQALRLADDRSLWAEIAIHEEDLPLVGVGRRVELQPPGPGRAPLIGQIAFVSPALDPMTRTARARVELANADRALKAGMLLLCAIEVPLGERLAVPEDAVVYTGDARLVFRDLGGGRIAPRPVRIGARTGGWIEIVEGLEPGDRVVASGVFLVASEARIRGGFQP